MAIFLAARTISAAIAVMPQTPRFTGACGVRAAWAYNYALKDVQGILDTQKSADRMPLTITSAWDGNTLRHACE